MSYVNADLAAELGARLSQAGVTWSIDHDGDVVVRLKSTEDHCFMPARVEFQLPTKARVEFFQGTSRIRNGERVWDLPEGQEDFILASKVVTLYFRPYPDRLVLQVYPSVEFVDKPFSVLVDTSEVRLQALTTTPGVERTTGPDQTGLVTALSVVMPNALEVQSMIRWGAKMGLAMFDEVTTGRFLFPQMQP